MAHLIPDIRSFNPLTPGEHTERDILQQLERGLADSYTVFHHLYWANARPQGDQHGELDVVVMNRAGDLAVLEIKAGELDMSAQGLFKQHGEKVQDVGVQVQRQFSNLQARVRQRGWGIRLLHFLVLPHHRIEQWDDTIQFPRERIIDAQACEDLPGEISRTLSQGLDAPAVRSQVHDFMLDQLGMQLDVTALSGRLSHQVRSLSGGLATWVPRITAPTGLIRVQATAGSGKTQLALGLLRRSAEQGLRSAYVCFNRPLADHLRDIAPPVSRGVEIATFHQLCWEQAGRPTADTIDFESMTRSYLACASQQPADLDLLVIDEMQDMQADWVDALVKRLKDAGQLYILDDPDQCLYPDRDGIELPDAVIVKSQENFRSPRRIVELINLLRLTSQPVVPCSPYRGEDPGIQTYQPGLRSLKTATIAAVENCQRKGFALTDIVILTWRGRERSELHGDMLGSWVLRRFNGAYDDAGRPVWTNGDLTVETIRRFKGQASPALVITEVDFDDLTPDKRALLFVALTRAQLHVELVVSQQAELALARQVA